MFISELLLEAIESKHASFCFGRMNPPTIGHKQLINAVAAASKGSDYFIFVSQTQDAKKNPLDYETKTKFLKALFPDQANHIIHAPEIKTIMQVAEWLYNKGYTSVTFVAGSDRLPEFEKLLNAYNGIEGKNIYYKFDNISYVSSGERDPDADGVTGVSASAAREAAVEGNEEKFAQITGARQHALALYQAVRQGMGLGEEEFIPNNAVNMNEGDEVPRHERIASAIEIAKRFAARKYPNQPGLQITGIGDVDKGYFRAEIRWPVQGSKTFKETRYHILNWETGQEKQGVIEGTFTNSEVRYMPGRGRGNQSGSYTWKHDNEYGWHVRAPNGTVIFQSKNPNQYQAKEEAKSKCQELNRDSTSLVESIQEDINTLTAYIADENNGGGSGMLAVIADLRKEIATLNEMRKPVVNGDHRNMRNVTGSKVKEFLKK